MGEENIEEKDKHKASEARRRLLREADASSSSIPTVSNFFAIERYYEASDKVLQTFETAFEKRLLDDAYVYGMRYCTFCVKGIVNHDYFNSAKYAGRKLQMNQRVDAVLTKLEQVAEWMDQEETEKQARQAAILKRQREELLRKQKELFLDLERLADIERRLAKQKEDFSSFQGEEKKEGENVEGSAMAKLQRLSQPAAEAVSPPPSSEEAIKKRVTFQQPAEPDGHMFLSTASFDANSLPPPMLPPNLKEEDDVDSPPSESDSVTPPSYHQIIANQSYFGPGAVTRKSSSSDSSKTPQAPSYDTIMKQRTSKKTSTPKHKLSIREYVSQASRRYHDYLQRGKIRNSTLGTYQGRIPGSTNGCTVISACVVSKHLQGRGITDGEVQAIIDKECVGRLRAIRSKLGLGGGSLIIPSDVHDHMVDQNLLHQHKFVGAAGGNICDPNHVHEVYKMLLGEAGKTSAYNNNNNNNNRNRSYPTNDSDQYLQEQIEAIMAREAAEANEAAAEAPRAEQREREERERQVAAQKVWEQKKHDQLQDQVNQKILAHLRTVAAEAKETVQSDWRDQQFLKQSKEVIDQDIADSSNLIQKLEAHIATVDAKTEEIEQWLEESNKAAGEQQVSVDDLCQPATKVDKQMLNLFSENAAITDALYFLDRGMYTGHIDCSTHLKTVRELAKRQFLVRAHLLKINQVLLQKGRG